MVFIQGCDYFVSEMRGRVEMDKELAMVGIVPDDGRADVIDPSLSRRGRSQSQWVSITSRPEQ